MLFIKVDPSQIFPDNHLRCQSFALVLAKYCLKYGIDGIIVQQSASEETEKLEDVIKAIRISDPSNKLTVICAGCRYQGVRDG